MRTIPLTKVRFRGYGNNLTETSVEELLAAAKADPFFPHPYHLLKTMLADSDRPTEGVSVTELLGYCLRCKLLQKYTEYTEDLDGMWPRWRGTVYHSLLEAAVEKDEVAEVRFWTKLPNGGLLHGKPDLIMPARGALVDLKTTKHIPKWDKVWDEHNQQLQIYRYLINHADESQDISKAALKKVSATDFRTLGIWYVDDEGYKPLEVRKTVQVATKEGAKNATKGVKVPDIWTDDQVLDFVIPRYDDIVVAEQVYLDSGRLPDYPPGVDPMNWWPHRFSATAYACLLDHFKGKN